MTMEIDLASFLSPAGSLLGEVTQRVLEFLSVQDLIEYVASSASSDNGNVTGTKGSSTATEDETGSPENPRRRRQQRSPPAASGRGGWVEASVRGGKSAVLPNRTNSGQSTSSSSGSSPEGELPHRREKKRSTTGAGDEAGGGSRPPTPYRRRSYDDAEAYPEDQQEEHEEWGDASTINQEFSSSGDRDRYRGVDGGTGRFDPTKQEEEQDLSFHTHRQSGRRGSGVQVAALRSHAEGEPRGQSKPTVQCIKREKEVVGVFGILIGLGLHPWAALGALRGGVAHLLGGVPLLALLRWASGGASAVLGVSFRVALLPYDVTKGLVGYVVGSLEAMLNVATEIWNELRHLSLSELAVVISCVVSGNALPDFLLHPLDYGGLDSGLSCGDGGGGGTGRNSHRIFSQSSRGTTSLESDGGGGVLSERVRGASSGNSDAGSHPGAGATGSRGAWQRAHSMRRRLDRVNRTASLVSYEERAESAVPRAKAQRVRRRMHYAMSLQCFQATVTVNNGQPSSRGGSDEGDDSPPDGRMSAGGGAFMCTPQSFPPTPVSRAHVMARTSQFSDDILFLARDQLRLGENLKPGVDETTRATADFLRRQQRLAVLDGNNACEGIILTCGHHRATKVGPSLYSSARAMVPVLRNRHVYFQVSCVREGPLAPSIGVGLSTPEMPLSTLVGAFSNSVGLCSTGQVLMSSRWYGAPGEYAMRKACMSTVGVLVYLDGSRPFRSWDGDMVRALVCFSVDGRLVRVATGPVPQAAAANAISATVPGVGGSFPQQQHPVAYGPPPIETPEPQELVVEADTPTTAPSPAALIEEAQEESPRQHGGGDDLFSPPPSPWSLPEEEMAPWEVAAAEATSARALGGGGAADFGRASTADQGPRVVPAFGGVTAMTPAVVPPPPLVPEISAALGLALPKDRDLFPTVTIHSANTEILCRFCAEDLLPVTRESIGAPPGVPVYALDGSLIHLP